MSNAMIRKATFEVRSLALHARPAALMVSCIHDFDCDVTFRKTYRAYDVGGQQVVVPSDEQADGKSILAMLALACGQGCVVEVTCEGPDAQDAIDALRQLRDDESYEGREPDGLMFAAVE